MKLLKDIRSCVHCVGDLPFDPKPVESFSTQSKIVIVGKYSQNHFLGQRKKETLTETVRNWRDYYPDYFVLPHPSPRNNIWLRKNPWFKKGHPVSKRANPYFTRALDLS